MDKFTLQRQVKWRIEILKHASEITKNVAKTCRHFGVSRKTFYKWKQRYEISGEAGLCDLSRRPLNSPKETSRDAVSKILYLRQNYHFGPSRISDYLKRYHNIQIAQSTVHRVLQRHELSRLPSNRRKYERPKNQWKRYEKQKPGHRLQVDVKFLERIPGSLKRLYQSMTAAIKKLQFSLLMKSFAGYLSAFLLYRQIMELSSSRTFIGIFKI
jgi:transposase